jgi:hypothetical protein
MHGSNFTDWPIQSNHIFEIVKEPRSNFTDWPIQSNHIFEIVKEPLWANAEPILLLPFSAQSYINILLRKEQGAIHPHSKLWGILARRFIKTISCE